MSRTVSWSPLFAMLMLLAPLTAHGQDAIVSSSALPGASAEGIATCGMGPRRGLCLLSWSFPRADGRLVWIQRFATIPQQWEDVQGPLAEDARVSAEPLPGGSLYRAVACRGASRSDCVSTTVVWAPIWLDDAAEIPATIRFTDGNYARIDKRADLISQLLEYNVYRYAQFAEGAGDLSKLPRMAKPGPRMDTLEETVYANVYPQYMRRRACSAAQNLPID